MDRCPQVIPVFLGKHMQCVGCCMAHFDTLQEAARNYGLQWDGFRSDLEQAILKLPPSQKGVEKEFS